MKSSSSSALSKVSSALATQHSGSSCSSSLSRVSSPVIGDDNYVSQVFKFTPVPESAKDDLPLAASASVTPVRPSSYASVVASGTTTISTKKNHSSPALTLSVVASPFSAKPSSVATPNVADRDTFTPEPESTKDDLPLAASAVTPVRPTSYASVVTSGATTTSTKKNPSSPALKLSVLPSPFSAKPLSVTTPNVASRDCNLIVIKKKKKKMSVYSCLSKNLDHLFPSLFLSILLFSIPSLEVKPLPNLPR